MHTMPSQRTRTVTARAYLDGCLEVDLEAPATTNALPVRRMDLPVAAAAAAPAAWFALSALAVERLEQPTCEPASLRTAPIGR